MTKRTSTKENISQQGSIQKKRQPVRLQLDQTKSKATFSQQQNLVKWLKETGSSDNFEPRTKSSSLLSSHRQTTREREEANRTRNSLALASLMEPTSLLPLTTMPVTRRKLRKHNWMPPGTRDSFRRISEFHSPLIPNRRCRWRRK